MSDIAATSDVGGASGTRWGRQTALAVENFRISGERMPVDVLHAIVLVKAEAAAVNAARGVIDEARADAIRRACDEVLAGEFADQFPVDVFQTGSGTSSNMNVNEVVASRAAELLGDDVHPNDHVNASQSSNDVVPTAIRIAAVTLAEHELLPALERLRDALRDRATEHDSTVKLGRTHLMDAAPVTFGAELRGWARMVELGSDRVRDALGRARELPLGGTAVGTGLNAPAGFGADVIARLAQRTGIGWVEAVDHFEAQSTQDALVELSAASRAVALSLHKIAGDLRLLGSGPEGGLGEIELPELQAGSSIMPGKVNPVIPEVVQQVAAQVVGNDATIVFASTLSTLQLNTAMPVIARNLVSSLRLLSTSSTALADKCVRSLTANTERMRHLAERSAAITMILVPHVGYDVATRVSKTMTREGLSLADALAAEGVELPVEVDLLKLAKGE